MPLQDLSYLTADRYAALMRHWLSTAKPLSTLLHDSKSSLKDYCNITQPLDPDKSDVYLTYKDNADFERLGKDLAPMLFSVSGGVSVNATVTVTIRRALASRGLHSGCCWVWSFRAKIMQPGRPGFFLSTPDKAVTA